MLLEKNRFWGDLRPKLPEIAFHNPLINIPQAIDKKELNRQERIEISSLGRKPTLGEATPTCELATTVEPRQPNELATTVIVIADDSNWVWHRLLSRRDAASVSFVPRFREIRKW